jgi:ligand-binding sensor domain-containing protein
MIKKSNKFIRFLHDDRFPTSLSGDEIRSITQDDHGHLFFATNNGLNKLMPDGKSFQVFRHEDHSPPSILSDLVYTVVALPGHKLWIGSEEGLNIFDCDKAAFISVKPDKRKSFSLINKSVRSIYVAKKRNYLAWYLPGGSE